MDILSSGMKKSGRCREVAVSGGSTLVMDFLSTVFPLNQAYLSYVTWIEACCCLIDCIVPSSPGALRLDWLIEIRMSVLSVSFSSN